MIIRKRRLNEDVLKPWPGHPDGIDLTYAKGSQRVSVWLEGDKSCLAYGDKAVDASIGSGGKGCVSAYMAKKIGEEIAQKIKKGQPVTAQYLQSKGFKVTDFTIKKAKSPSLDDTLNSTRFRKLNKKSSKIKPVTIEDTSYGPYRIDKEFGKRTSYIIVCSSGKPNEAMLAVSAGAGDPEWAETFSCKSEEDLKDVLRTGKKFGDYLTKYSFSDDFRYVVNRKFKRFFRRISPKLYNEL